MVIDNACEVVSRVTIALDEHEVVQKFVLVADVSTDHVIEFRDARFRNLEADNSLFTSSNAGFGFFAADVTAVAIVTCDRHVRLFLFGADFLQAFFCAEAVISATRIQELLDFAMVDVQAFALEIRTAVSFATRTFIPLEAKPLEITHQVMKSRFVITLTVSILDAQVERTTHVFCKEVIVNRRASATHMQVTRGAWSKAYTNRTFFSHNFL